MLAWTVTFIPSGVRVHRSTVKSGTGQMKWLFLTVGMVIGAVAAFAATIYEQQKLVAQDNEVLSDFKLYVLLGFISAIIILSKLSNENLKKIKRLYNLQKEHELLWTALDDIARMHKNESVGRYAQKALKNIETKYGNY
jgi:hypothetical protein